MELLSGGERSLGSESGAFKDFLRGHGEMPRPRFFWWARGGWIKGLKAQGY